MILTNLLASYQLEKDGTDLAKRRAGEEVDEEFAEIKRQIQARRGGAAAEAAAAQAAAARAARAARTVRTVRGRPAPLPSGTWMYAALPPPCRRR